MQNIKPRTATYLLPDFAFDDGQVMSPLRLQVTTLGSPVRDGAGRVSNAVLILHGTGGQGDAFLQESFAGVLFGPGQLLDAARYYIILPDGIGHGRSSKPSDGLRAAFPRYTYADMIRAQSWLLTEHLGVDHLRLVMGTSMGGMHTWLWGIQHPDFMDALLPLASLPVQIAGRNRMMRRMIIDAIRGDPQWQDGNYQEQPAGLVSAIHILLFMVSSPWQWQQQAPTQAAADQLLAQLIDSYLSRFDANDLLYQFDASRDYDPAPHLERIRAPLMAINSADDQVNPPELGIMEAAIQRLRRGQYILLPTSPQTRGHGTHSLPALWQGHLAELLRTSQ